MSMRAEEMAISGMDAEHSLRRVHLHRLLRAEHSMAMPNMVPQMWTAEMARRYQHLIPATTRSAILLLTD